MEMRVIIIPLIVVSVGALLFHFYSPIPRRFVGAYYYAWNFWDHQFFPEYTPTEELENGADPATWPLTIELASSAGIDFFALSYWNPDYDNIAHAFFSANEQLGNPMQFVIMIEYYRGNALSPESKQVNLSQLADHIFASFAGYPAYFRWANKPLLLIYTRDPVVIAWDDSRFTIRYVPLQVPYGSSIYYADPIIYKEFQGVMPGFNNLLVTWDSYKNNIPRENGDFYRRQWQQAIAISRQARTPTAVLITSWNEWLEQTSIAPANEYGNLYLDITREYAQKYKEG